VTREEQLALLREVIRASKTQKFLRHPSSTQSEIERTAEILLDEVVDPYLDLVMEKYPDVPAND